jgi:hypothetical protein
MRLVRVLVLAKLVGSLVRGEEDMSGCDEEELAGVARVEDEESPRALDRWVSSAQMGRPRVVEKGSQARAVGSEVGTSLYLYILGAAERKTSDSRISTSSIP